MNARLFADHVDYIAEKNGVTVHAVLENRDQARANSMFGIIVIAPVTDEVSYAIALHELGHCIDPDGGHEDKLTRERAAWRWAEENAIVWTQAMADDKLASLGHFGGTVPDADHPTYERQARLDRVRAEWNAVGASRPKPGKETIAEFMQRRKRR